MELNQIQKDEDSEGYVIHQLLFSEEYRDSNLLKLNKWCFTDDSYKLILELITKRSDSGDLISAKTIIDDLSLELGIAQTDTERLISIIPAPPSEDLAENAIKSVVKFSRIRSQKQIAVMMASVDPSTEEGAKQFEQLQRELSEIPTVDFLEREKLRPIGEGLRSNLDKITDVMQNPGPRGVLTGYKDLDQITGGMEAGRLWVIGAESSGGKSALAQHFLTQAITDGRRTLSISLEMSELEMHQRMYAQKGIPMDAVTGKRRASKDELMSLRTAAQEMDGIASSVMVGDAAGATLEDIRMTISDYQRDIGDIEVLLVDYLQIMAAPAGHNRENEIAVLAQSLKVIAQEFNCCVITPSQLNKSGDARESQGIEFAADVFLKIRSSVKAETAEGEIIDHGNLYVFKNRGGERFVTLPYLLDGGYMRFERYDPQNPPRHPESKRVIMARNQRNLAKGRESTPQ